MYPFGVLAEAVVYHGFLFFQALYLLALYGCHLCELLQLHHYVIQSFYYLVGDYLDDESQDCSHNTRHPHEYPYLYFSMHLYVGLCSILHYGHNALGIASALATTHAHTHTVHITIVCWVAYTLKEGNVAYGSLYCTRLPA